MPFATLETRASLDFAGHPGQAIVQSVGRERRQMRRSSESRWLNARRVLEPQIGWPGAASPDPKLKVF
jgi:hypothetical protein